MKRILSTLALICLAGSASAQLTVTRRSPITFSGDDGQPAGVTSVLSS